MISASAMFSIIIFLCLLIPIIALVILSILKLLEKEFDYLQMENKQIQLQTQLHQMEYLQLSQQIRPHFLFNSLNAMMSLARLNRNEDLIQSMEKFSLFLRYQNRDKESLVPFESELEHTKNYLAIQKLRFGKKLEVDITVDENALPTLLPPYTLQTFVENAFKHGLENKRGEKRLKIELRREGNWVILKVIDNGNSETEQFITNGDGTGMENIRKRLELLFELHTEVSMKRKPEWTEVKAIWPYSPGESQ
ncbi:sensor histidine kinase [Mesobacillus sp.]|uniref:sensor histidine kinase n=1 Tax=Mesobacillus sp. TaxID=2675271 RepID=UPI0039EFB17A